MASACYFLFISNIPIKKRVITLLLCLIAGTFLLFYLGNTPLIANLLNERLGMQNYDTERFSTQKAAFEAGFSNLIGMGPGQSDENLEMSTHSLYARLFAENGLIGFLSFFVFFILSMLQALKRTLRSSYQVRGLYSIIFASLVGLIFNSLFIDTLHWRHFWLLLALAWCAEEEINEGMPEPIKIKGR
ncbi:hypothetical protein I5776_12255 [Heyndrickxia vini]|uniref:Polymerase n=1 Tax=Heyndrickxia vini TaxID=1476025 RepID=A0ABX7DWJ1_9BACI|nr:hypothetical protein [Heyndrickxia vini]QQZ07863.1 hypothetical protein I5776_12255 [Heyndrickxia vini]